MCCIVVLWDVDKWLIDVPADLQAHVANCSLPLIASMIDKLISLNTSTHLKSLHEPTSSVKLRVSACRWKLTDARDLSELSPRKATFLYFSTTYIIAFLLIIFERRTWDNKRKWFSFSTQFKCDCIISFLKELVSVSLSWAIFKHHSRFCLITPKYKLSYYLNSVVSLRIHKYKFAKLLSLIKKTWKLHDAVSTCLLHVQN